MADWDADSAELEQNLRRVLKKIRNDARRRVGLSIETARQWHAEILRGLAVPEPRYVGRFRGEPGLEKVQVHVAGRFGIAARDVTTALAEFERALQPVIARLDELIRRGTDPSADQHPDYPWEPGRPRTPERPTPLPWRRRGQPRGYSSLRPTACEQRRRQLGR